MFASSQHALACGEIQISFDFIRIIAVTAETFFFQQWIYFQGKDLIDLGMGLVLICSVGFKIPAGRGNETDHECCDMRTYPGVNTPSEEESPAVRRCDKSLNVGWIVHGCLEIDLLCEREYAFSLVRSCFCRGLSP
jgi:hypothetical protein